MARRWRTDNSKSARGDLQFLRGFGYARRLIREGRHWIENSGVQHPAWASRWSGRGLRRMERPPLLTALSVGCPGRNEHGGETILSLGPQHFDGCPSAQGRLLGLQPERLTEGRNFRERCK